MKYTANLDGLGLGDVLQSTDGVKITLASVMVHKIYSYAYTMQGIDSKNITVEHSETNNNCWKFYKL